MRSSLLPILAALLLAGCNASNPALPPAAISAQAAEQRLPVTILISIDGFKPDYVNSRDTPTLARLSAQGVSARMRPSFPSKTFPNHWTLVTGLRPDRHGIVANVMEDAARPGERFTMASDDPFWWNAAEPIWVTADKAGVRTGVMFWPGNNVGWGGTRTGAAHNIAGGRRPDDWHQFNQAITNKQRVNSVIDWLRRPAATRPQLLTLYFDTVDTAGHDYGPGDPRTTAAVREADARIGELVQQLQELGQPANLLIVADHGMAATSSERVIALDAILPPADARIIEYGTYASFQPEPGREQAVADALLKPRPHMQCWRRENIPARFAYGHNPRVPPFLCLAEVGWLIYPHAPASTFAGGNHGYDNAAPEMAALFIASGPAFRPGVKLPPFDNVDVAPLLRDLLKLPKGEGLDGDTEPFRAAMR
ncbi:alkaline phosphatase family protein [Sandaracinobacter neustonicus]|uniref:Alkaline phosphatase family protein n=1 Tax=Sandaracinobacter neustonicus TaxID=1715348 RepID=A0A501XT46_9SPHN|nr:ectonucleotide pyrophosphatase/phosphodiesterase [Sandaracinobacter neustonicus]TPE63952.1 alkaline phosphatase family protein [Sandaracinobacter neustonicus]